MGVLERVSELANGVNEMVQTVHSFAGTNASQAYDALKDTNNFVNGPTGQGIIRATDEAYVATAVANALNPNQFTDPPESQDPSPPATTPAAAEQQKEEPEVIEQNDEDEAPDKELKNPILKVIGGSGKGEVGETMESLAKLFEAVAGLRETVVEAIKKKDEDEEEAQADSNAPQASQVAPTAAEPQASAAQQQAVAPMAAMSNSEIPGVHLEEVAEQSLGSDGPAAAPASTVSPEPEPVVAPAPGSP